jgi:hypothetical protein
MFAEAYRDFKYLRENGFPEKASLKLVGDRYRLTRIARNCLFRGVVPARTAEARYGKIADAHDVAGKPLGIDWYNVLITVESYLRGTILFIADDGVLRDSSATHGSFRESSVSAKAIDEITGQLAELHPLRVDIFLDSPIAFSAVMAEELRARFSALDAFPADVRLEHSADYPLKTYTGIVATSDSIILDAALRVFDLPRRLLERRFGFNPLPLREIGRPGDAGPFRLYETESPLP